LRRKIKGEKGLPSTRDSIEILLSIEVIEGMNKSAIAGWKFKVVLADF
jgi:hypothetical protein